MRKYGLTCVPGRRYYLKSHLLNDLSVAVIEIITEYFTRAPSPLTNVLVAHMGGAISEANHTETAFPHRNAIYNLSILSCWEDAENDDKNIAWTRELFDILQPFAGGVYVNEMVDEDEERIHLAYGASYQRLVELKNKYDPSNTLRLNQNILPTA